MNAESALTQVVKELQSSNLSQDLILDTIDNYDFTLASTAARENTTEVPGFLDKLVNVATDLQDKFKVLIRSNVVLSKRLDDSKVKEATVETPDFLDRLVKVAIDLKDKFDVLIRSNVVLAKRLDGNKLQEREDRDEMLDALKGLKPDKTRFAPTKDSSFEMPGGIFSGILSAAALLAGFATGFVAQLTSSLFSVIGKTKLFQKIGGIFSTIGQFFTNIVTRLKASPLLKGVFTSIEKITELVNRFKSGKLFTLLGKVFSIFGNSPIIRTVSSVAGIIGEGFSMIGGIFSDMFRFFKIGMNAGGRLAKIVLGIGKIAGPLLKVLGWPLTIAMGVYGAIKGAIAGFKEGGLIDGLKGMFVGLFDGLVGSLLDSIKDGISWIAEKLGFSEFSKFLDGFSFTELYSKYFIDPMFAAIEKVGEVISGIPGMLVDFFTTLPEKLGALFSSAGESITGAADSLASSIDEMQRAAIRSILPDPNEELSKFNPKYWVRKAIPDSIYKYAYETTKKEETSSSEKSASSEKITTASATNNFTELTKTEKAMAAGYGSWDEYKAAGWEWKNNLQTVPPVAGNMLAAAGNVSAVAPTVIVNNNNGGNVSNISTSNVNNNAAPAMPIITGTAMGY